MKLFMIDLDNVDWDTYDSCVIAANSREEVEEMCRKNEFPIVRSLSSFDIDENQNYTITEIRLEDIKEPTTLCSSFNAG